MITGIFSCYDLQHSPLWRWGSRLPDGSCELIRLSSCSNEEDRQSVIWWKDGPLTLETFWPLLVNRHFSLNDFPKTSNHNWPVRNPSSFKDFYRMFCWDGCHLYFYHDTAAGSLAGRLLSSVRRRTLLLRVFLLGHSLTSNGDISCVGPAANIYSSCWDQEALAVVEPWVVVLCSAGFDSHSQ